MRIDSDGNIGIGITTPHAKLQINNSNAYTLGESDYNVDSIFLYGHDGSSNGTRFGGITWGFPNGRRRAGISAISESPDSDYIGLSFCTQGTDGPGPFAESMRITRNGNIGIGHNSPDFPLQFAQGNGPKICFHNSGSGAGLNYNYYGFATSPASLNYHVNVDAQHTFHSGGIQLAIIKKNNTTNKGNVESGAFVTFTGAHLSITKEQYNNINDNELSNNVDNYKNNIGYLVRSTGKYYNLDDNNEREKPTISESLPIIELTNKEKDPACFGIIGGVQNEDNFNKIKRLTINSLGEGAIMVSNYNGNIVNGDYITSSALEGLSMKQDDDILHSYTVAKSTQDEDFTSDYQEMTHSDGQTYRYKLIGCTYHCG